MTSTGLGSASLIVFHILLSSTYDTCYGDYDLEEMGCGKDFCYHLSPVPKDWKSAKELCLEHDMTMAMPKDRPSVEYLENLFEEYHSEEDTEMMIAWLGGRSYNLMSWKWNNHKDYKNQYGTTIPPPQSTNGARKCAYMEKRSGQRYLLNTTNCNSTLELPWVCRRDNCVLGDPGCDVTISTERGSWYEASQRCMLNGLVLFNLASSENWNNTTINKLWIGLIDTNWTWNDGKSVNFFNWEMGQPTSHSERCISIGQGGKWNDSECNKEAYVLCQQVAAPGKGLMVIIPVVISILTLVIVCLIILGSYRRKLAERCSRAKEGEVSYDDVLVAQQNQENVRRSTLEGNTYEDIDTVSGSQIQARVNKGLEPDSQDVSDKVPQDNFTNQINEKSDMQNVGDNIPFYSQLKKDQGIDIDSEVTIVENDIYGAN